jgi:hypothetical protein
LLAPDTSDRWQRSLSPGINVRHEGALRHFGLHRSTYGYRAKEADAWEAKMKGTLRLKSNEHPELGYAKIIRLLKQEGWQVGARNVQRLRWEIGLAVPAKKLKRRRQGVSTGFSTKGKHRGHIRTWGFVHCTSKRWGNCECSISSMSIPGSACVSMLIGRSTPVK